jgi:hypothetical protein
MKLGRELQLSAVQPKWNLADHCRDGTGGRRILVGAEHDAGMIVHRGFFPREAQRGPRQLNLETQDNSPFGARHDSGSEHKSRGTAIGPLHRFTEFGDPIVHLHRCVGIHQYDMPKPRVGLRAFIRGYESGSPARI